MAEELYHGDESRLISFSQINKLYRSEFKNVSIPKVSTVKALIKTALFNNYNPRCYVVIRSNFGHAEVTPTVP